MIHDEAQKAAFTGQIMPAELAEHLGVCPECQTELGRLKALESRLASARPAVGDRAPWEEDLLGRLTAVGSAASHRKAASGGGWMAVAASTILAAAGLAVWMVLTPTGSGSPAQAVSGAGQSWTASEYAAGQDWLSLDASGDTTAALLQRSEALSSRIPETATEDLEPYLAPFDAGGWDG